MEFYADTTTSSAVITDTMDIESSFKMPHYRPPEVSRVHIVDMEDSVDALHVMTKFAMWLISRISILAPSYIAEHIGRMHSVFGPAVVYKAIGCVMKDSENELISSAFVSVCIEHMYEFDHFIEELAHIEELDQQKYIEWLRQYADNFYYLSEVCAKEKQESVSISQFTLIETNQEFQDVLIGGMEEEGVC